MALAPLGVFVAALVALGLAALLTLLTLAVVRFLSNIPYGVGGWIAGKAQAAENAISNALGQAFSGIDSFIGGTIHQLARFLDGVWNVIRTNANLLLALAGPVSLLWAGVSGIRALVHRLTATNVHSDARLKAVTRELGRLESWVEALQDQQARGIGADVQPQINALDREIDRIRNKTIPAIRERLTTDEGSLGNLYDWVAGKASLLGVGTFAFAVAAVLDSLGLGSIRCSSLGNMFNKRGCGLWNDLESILGLLADTVLLTNICSLLPLLETAVSDVADPLVIALTDVGAGLCDGGIGPPPALPAVSLYLPASPSLTLNLP